MRDKFLLTYINRCVHGRLRGRELLSQKSLSIYVRQTWQVINVAVRSLMTRGSTTLLHLQLLIIWWVTFGTCSSFLYQADTARHAISFLHCDTMYFRARVCLRRLTLSPLKCSSLQKRTFSLTPPIMRKCNS